MSATAIDSGNNIWLSLLEQQMNKTQTTNAATENGATDATENTGNVDFAQLITSKLDTDGNGTISDEELQKGIGDARELMAALHPHQAQLRAYEAQGSLPPCQEDAADQTKLNQTEFSEIDTNNDGTISNEEFAIGMEALRARQSAADAAADATTEKSDSSSFSTDQFSLPGLMGGMGSLMNFMGQGQGNMPAYNEIMGQLLQR